MTELLVVIVAFLVVIGLLVWERDRLMRAHAAERRHLVNAVIAKNGGELLALDREPREPREESDKVKLAKQLDNPLGIG